MPFLNFLFTITHCDAYKYIWGNLESSSDNTPDLYDQNLNGESGLTSYLHKKQNFLGYIGIIAVWNADLKSHGETFDWKRIWISRTSCNHQVTQYKMIRRYYLSIRKS